jgi:DDE family transposase
MNRRVRRALAAGKRKIEKRNADGVREGGDAPVMSGANIHYEIAQRTHAIIEGGIGAIHRMVKKLKLPKLIDARLKLLKKHMPYHESDHVLNIAYNAMCGGRTLDDIELRRMNSSFLDALGAKTIPDPTTAGDFCRRFAEGALCTLQDVINQVRIEVWRLQPASFRQTTARIDADGSIVSTTGECKEGMDISHKGIWGYHPLLVSLANTGEALFVVNRSGSRPSHDGVIPFFDEAIALCRRGGFTRILLRGDTDFSQTSAFDRWTDDGVFFVFGYDARKNLVERADGPLIYAELVRRAERVLKTQPRARPAKVKEEIVRLREFKSIHLKSEDVAEFDYQPLKCKRSYRVVVTRKNLSIEKGEEPLIEDIRYFFYITNDRTLSATEVVREACQRCNQENLIEQLKNGVRALHAPVNTLNANWAYMIMAALAWTLKAWAALLLPINPRWEEKHLADREVLLRMDFRTFYNNFIRIPCQIVRTARTIVYRFLAWTPFEHLVFRLLEVV